jgi:hypothetical protein
MRIRTIVLLLLSSTGVAHAAQVTGAVDGSCETDSEPALSELGDSVGQAWAFGSRPDPRRALEELDADREIGKMNAVGVLPKCVGRESELREAREHQELDRIEKAVRTAAREQCMKTTCVGNATYLVTGYSHNFFNFFGGCENWSRLATDTIGGSLQYHTIEREQRCNAPGHCHYVVVLRNPRTSDVRTVDAWAYAGGWVFGGVKNKNASVFGSYDDFKLKYGLRTDHETGFGDPSCDNGATP